MKTLRITCFSLAILGFSWASNALAWDHVGYQDADPNPVESVIYARTWGHVG